MRLTSSAFEHHGNIPKVYTCQGDDINPPLEINDVPEDAKSLALIMDDPDVPVFVRQDKMWVHWVLFNMEPTIRTIVENTPPIGILGRNTGGQNAYQGPCPPNGEHRYFLKLFALDTLLDLAEETTKEELLQAMEGHILAKTELMGRYAKT